MEHNTARCELNSLTDKIEIRSKLISMAKLKFIQNGSVFVCWAKSPQSPPPSSLSCLVGVGRLFPVAHGICALRNSNSVGRKKVAEQPQQEKLFKNTNSVELRSIYVGSRIYSNVGDSTGACDLFRVFVVR